MSSNYLHCKHFDTTLTSTNTKEVLKSFNRGNGTKKRVFQEGCEQHMDLQKQRHRVKNESVAENLGLKSSLILVGDTSPVNNHF